MALQSHYSQVFIILKSFCCLVVVLKRGCHSLSSWYSLPALFGKVLTLCHLPPIGGTAKNVSK